MPKATKRARQQANRIARREAELAARKRAARRRTLRNFLVVGVLIAAVVVILAIRSSGDSAEAGVRCTDDVPLQGVVGLVYDAAPPVTIDATHTYQAIIDTSCGKFTVDLDAASAPQGVNSFVALARDGYYDGLTWHRAVNDFVIQGGDQSGDGSGGPGYTIPEEPPADGYQKGSFALAKAAEPATSGSQFFVVLSDDGARRLGGPPYLYTGLGLVSSGMDVVDKLGSFADPAGSDGPPTRDLYINSIEIVEKDAGGTVVTTTTAPTSTTTTVR